MLCWSSREEIPHAQGKRNPSEMVGVPRGHQTADAGSQHSHPTDDKVMQKRSDKQGFRTQRTPWTCPSIYLKNQNLSVLLFYVFHQLF